MQEHNIFHMASFSRSGETLMQRCLNGHPDIETVHQLNEPDIPQDMSLFKFLSTYAPTTIAADNPEIAHRAQSSKKSFLLKNAVWSHQHPRQGFILIRNPFSIVASAYRENPGSDQAKRQKNQQLRWAREIDPLMMPAMRTSPTIVGFLALYARKMLHDKKSGLPFVRYEDFILRPEHYLRKIIGHLGLNWHDGVMNSHEAYKEGELGHGGIQLWQPIHTKSEAKYKSMTAETKALTYSLTNEVLQAYGYQWDGEDVSLHEVEGLL